MIFSFSASSLHSVSSLELLTTCPTLRFSNSCNFSANSFQKHFHQGQLLDASLPHFHRSLRRNNTFTFPLVISKQSQTISNTKASPSPSSPSIDHLAFHSSFPKLPSMSVDESGQLTLDNIRSTLIRQEDSIIFNFIERAQYCMNSAAYDPKRIRVEGFDGSLLEYILMETEILHGKVRRYTSPMEHPFFPKAIPKSILPPIQYPNVLHPCANQININSLIWKTYIEHFLPVLVKEGDDSNYGSSTNMDVLCLQSLSSRIHYGKFVAEAKFRKSPESYEPLIKNQDAEGLMKLLTFEEVELRVQKRVELKASTFGQDVDLTHDEHDGHSYKFKIEPSVVGSLYFDWIMPLTKQVQVQYLLRRLDPTA